MIFDDAVEAAEVYTKKHSCTAFVNGSLGINHIGPGLYEPVINEEGWHVSDWFVSGSSVLKVHCGEAESC